MGTKKFIKNSKNSFLVEKIQPRSGKARASSIKSVLEDISIYQLRPKENFFLSSTRKWERASLINKKCLRGYFDLSSKTYRDFFFKFQKITRC